ncbi:hypothetical protein TNCV_3164801 [Trichonephila clavipes]|nr:hypothetical protein TNCV_3164801 [Trichonephila clavipes]
MGPEIVMNVVCHERSPIDSVPIVPDAGLIWRYFQATEANLLPGGSRFLSDDRGVAGRKNGFQWLGDTLLGLSYFPSSNAHVRTLTAGSDVVQSGRPIFDDFFQHLWPYIGNNTANVVFQMVKRLWLIRIDQ